MNKAYRLGLLLGYDVYIDLRNIGNSKQRELKLEQSREIFERFFKIHEAMENLREVLK